MKQSKKNALHNLVTGTGILLLLSNVSIEVDMCYDILHACPLAAHPHIMVWIVAIHVCVKLDVSLILYKVVHNQCCNTYSHTMHVLFLSGCVFESEHLFKTPT